MKAATAVPRARTRIDRNDIVLAACALLDEEGPAAFSMARVGGRLGVTAMALYRHVADRADLENAIVEHLLADLEGDALAVVGADDWEAGVAAWMEGVRAHWLRYPWIGRLIGGGHTLAPSWLRALGRLATILGDAGLPPDAVVRELTQISRVVVGIAMLEAQSPLPHRATFAPDALARLDPVERDRWEELGDELDRYDNDALFTDLVAQTIARIRVSTGGASLSGSPSTESGARRSRR